MSDEERERWVKEMGEQQRLHRAELAHLRAQVAAGERLAERLRLHSAPDVDAHDDEAALAAWGAAKEKP